MTSFAGYISLGGNEVVNSARAAIYSRALGIAAVSCDGCTTLNRVLDEPAYSSPDLDDAPWWDPTVVASKDFAGVLGLEIEGLSKAFNTREPIPLAHDGAALNPLRRLPREILVRGMMFARTECSLSYGRSWLAAAIRGGSCSQGCVGDELCYLACCPDCTTEPEPGVTDTCGQAEWRTLFNVGVLEGPVPGAMTRLQGGYLQEVEFTLTAGNPYIYYQPVLVGRGPTPEQQIPGNTPDTVVDCTEDTDCVRTAVVGCPPLPLPVLPLVPADPCYPTGTFTAYRSVVPQPAGLTPRWLENVPYLRIKAGATALTRVTLRWYANPGNLDCFAALADPDPDLRQLGPCDACAEVNIPVIPAGSTLTMDGRLERVWVDCPGGPGLATAEPPVYGPGGTSFQWPAFSCSVPLCLEIITRRPTSGSGVPDATWEIFTVAREDAS